MRDRLTKERRSWNMSRIRGKNTSPEIVVRKLLHRMGYRFRLHVRIPVGGKAEGQRPKAKWGSFNRRAQRNAKKRSNTQPGGASVPASRIRHSSKNPAIHSSTPRARLVRFLCPDIVLPKYKTAIFVHGCFWHRHRGCKNCTTPTNRREWWVAKLEGLCNAGSACLSCSKNRRNRHWRCSPAVS
jgi:DNA mismatch endonuclease Vsr